MVTNYEFKNIFGNQATASSSKVGRERGTSADENAEKPAKPEKVEQPKQSKKPDKPGKPKKEVEKSKYAEAGRCAS